MNLKRATHLMLLYAKVSVQNVTAYRFDMVMRIFTSILHLISELLVVWTIFYNTKSLNGWGWQHMLVLVGVYRIVAGGIRMSIVPNMRRVLEEIQDGSMDFVLLRPVNAQFLVSIREFVIWRLADVLLGGAVAVYGCIQLTGAIPLHGVLMFAAMLTAAFAIVYSIWLALATLCFWFVRIQNIEMVFWNVFEAGQFPIVIYPDYIRWSLTYIIPLAFIIMFPAGALLGDADKMPATAPLWAALIAVATLGLSAWFWRCGLRRYSGASA